MTHIDTLKNKTVEEMKLIIISSSSLEEVTNKCGIKRNQDCKEYIKTFIKDHNIDVSHMKGKSALSSRISKEDFELIIKKSICWMDVIRGMGRTFHGSYYASMKKLAEQYNIDTSHFDTKKALSIGNNMKRKPEEYFCLNSTVARHTIKNKIIKDKMIEYKCNKCNNDGNWQNNTLMLQLEHINGIRNDNRLENLCFLCPNCHSQTTTFTGKNGKHIDKIEIKLFDIEEYENKRNTVKSYKHYRKVENYPSKEELQKLLEEFPLTSIAKNYGVTDNSVRKWAKKYDLTWHGRGYWR